MTPISEIETMRIKAQVSVSALCAASGVGRQTYQDAVAGRYAPRPATLARLKQALHRHKIGFGAESGALAPHVAFKAVTALAAFELQADAHMALNARPARRATQDKQWLAASRCRMIAYVICNGSFGMKTADVARAAGVDKSTVSLGIREINDRRDTDPALDAVLTRMEGLFG